MVNIVFGLPPLLEQARIVKEIDRQLSIIDQVDNAVSLELKRSARLRQSVLRRAFQGTLVPQDPTDEPASTLLERVQAQCAKARSRLVPKLAKQETLFD
jgi:type I restriction enzyme, S subunit